MPSAPLRRQIGAIQLLAASLVQVLQLGLLADQLHFRLRALLVAFLHRASQCLQLLFAGRSEQFSSLRLVSSRYFSSACLRTNSTSVCERFSWHSCTALRNAFRSSSP